MKSSQEAFLVVDGGSFLRQLSNDSLEALGVKATRAGGMNHLDRLFPKANLKVVLYKLEARGFTTLLTVRF